MALRGPICTEQEAIIIGECCAESNVQLYREGTRRLYAIQPLLKLSGPCLLAFPSLQVWEDDHLSSLNWAQLLQWSIHGQLLSYLSHSSLALVSTVCSFTIS